MESITQSRKLTEERGPLLPIDSVDTQVDTHRHWHFLSRQSSTSLGESETHHSVVINMGKLVPTEGFEDGKDPGSDRRLSISNGPVHMNPNEKNSLWKVARFLFLL